MRDFCLKVPNHGSCTFSIDSSSKCVKGCVESKVWELEAERLRIMVAALVKSSAPRSWPLSKARKSKKPGIKIQYIKSLAGYSKVSFRSSACPGILLEGLGKRRIMVARLF